ncbi:GDSL-type esterase/lipase family protein [Pseudonocardia sp. RS010]|uniref:GDSL-type esterase/lipase family protein n=1 Tax=Pseudonocardia sp. RS010 TaxID=3385979 RepID=UPI0039A0CEFF
MSSSRDLRVVAVGDSFVAGVGDSECRGWFGRLASDAWQRGVPTTAYNLGVRRDTSGDVLDRWEREVAARRMPGTDERLMVSFGVNDSTVVNGRLRVTPERSVANLHHLLVGASRVGLAVMVIGPPPIADAEVNRRVVTLSGQFREVCAASGTPFVEVVHELLEDRRWMAEVRDGDGAHPGAAGYGRLAAIALPAWRAWIGPPDDVGAG